MYTFSDLQYDCIEGFEFDWDEGNLNKIEERFLIIEVEAFFVQTLFVIEDIAHSRYERRFIATGYGPSYFGKVHESKRG